MRNSMRSNAFALLCALIVVPHLVAAPRAVSATLTIEPAKTIPGLSLPMHVRIDNHGSVPFDFNRLKFRATPSAGGDPFIIRWRVDPHRGYVEDAPMEWTTESDSRFPIPRGKSGDVFVPVDAFDTFGWMYDTRICIPGIYRIEALIDDPTHPADPPLVSAAAEIEVLRPDDRDAAIYLRIAKGEIALGLADETYRNYPESPFLPYLALRLKRDFEKPEENIAILDSVLELHPRSPVALVLAIEIAANYEELAARKLNEGDLDGAVTNADRARATFRPFMEGRSAWARAKAEARYRAVPTREYYAERLEHRRKK